MKHFYKFFSQPNKKSNQLKNALLGFAFFLGGHHAIDAQVSTYSFAQSSGVYAGIGGTILDTASGNTSSTNLNSNVYPVTLPFNFVFNGLAYTSLNISTNGFVTFGATAPNTTTTTPISGTLAYDGAVSAFGRDLSSVFDINGSTGNISWETIGAAPNREFVIQWKNFRPNSSTSTTTAYVFSFQIRLQETTNVINMVYDNGSYATGSSTVSGTAQIGLRGSTNTDFNNRLNASSLEFINSTPGTANNSTQSFNTVNTVPGMPAAGLTYTWTPPSCYGPTDLSAGSLTSTMATVSWNSSPSSPAGGYEIYYSTNNTAPTSSTVPNISNITGNSVILDMLTPATTYYVWVRSNCGAGNTSVWSLLPLQFTTLCQPPAILSTTGATVCSGNTATLSATADAGATITWYDASTGGNVVGTGPTFTTPALTNTTTYYVSAATGAGAMSAGKPDAVSTTGYTLEAGLFFDAFTNFTINGVYVYPTGTGPGSVVIALQDGNVSPATTLQSVTVNLTGSGAPHVKTFVPLNFTVAPGNNYKLMMMSKSGSVTGLIRESGSSWGSYPLTIPNILSITSGNCCSGNTTSGSYYYFYDWQIDAKCESAREDVVAEVNCLSTSEVKGKEEIKISPNPFSEIININKPELVKSIRVTDISGKLIKTINQPGSVIRLSDLSQGLYILLLDMKDGASQSIKVIKK